MQAGFLRNAVILGFLSAIGPFAIDMYLPALPSIGSSLQAEPFLVQMSLLVFFLSVGVSQLVVGPLADIYGRKAPLYGGLAIFAIASIGSALSPTVEWLIGFRFLQGLGASAGMVVPRAVVRDLHTGPEATRLMSLLMLVFSISPILAPLVGSFIIAAGGWRWVFWAVLIAAGIATIALAFGLRETRSPKQRADSSFSAAFRGYAELIRDRKFVALALIGGFGISSFFVYLSNSSFVLIDHFGLTPTEYSLFFSLNAVAFFAVSQATGVLTARYGLRRIVRIAVSVFAAAMMALLAATLAGFGSLGVIAVLLFIGFGALGLVIPTTSVLAMDDHGENAGTASALLGTLQMVIGAVAMVVTGLFADATPLPMVVGIAGCALIAFAICAATLGNRDSAAADAQVAPAAE